MISQNNSKRVPKKDVKLAIANFNLSGFVNTEKL